MSTPEKSLKSPKKENESAHNVRAKEERTYRLAPLVKEKKWSSECNSSAQECTLKPKVLAQTAKDKAAT